LLFIDNDIVRQLLTMRDCIDALDRTFQEFETGEAMHRPRIDMYMPCERPDGYYRWGTVEGTTGGIFALRMKSDIITWPEKNGIRTEEKYCVRPGTWCGLIMLFNTQNGEPLGFINDGEISRYRVGAAAALGARHLARTDASRVGILGSGGMARAYLEGFCAIRPITSCRVYSPTRVNREAFAREMGETLGIDVVAVDGPEQAVRDADLVASCTDTMFPTVSASWLQPGMHVTDLCEEEIDDACLARMDVHIRLGDGGLPLPEQGRIKRLIGHSPVAYVAGTDEQMKRLPPKPPMRRNKVEFGWSNYCDLVFKRAKGRENDRQITFFHNFGNQGLSFASIGGMVYRKAREMKLGHEFPTSWFLQDVRN
jgi:alanine dehydrogenase